MRKLTFSPRPWKFSDKKWSREKNPENRRNYFFKKMKLCFFLIFLKILIPSYFLTCCKAIFWLVGTSIQIGTLIDLRTIVRWLKSERWYVDWTPNVGTLISTLIGIQALVSCLKSERDPKAWQSLQSSEDVVHRIDGQRTSKTTKISIATSQKIARNKDLKKSKKQK